MKRGKLPFNKIWNYGRSKKVKEQIVISDGVLFYSNANFELTFHIILMNSSLSLRENKKQNRGEIRYSYENL